MTPLIACTCGTQTDVDDPTHDALTAARATVLCPACDAADVERRRLVVDELEADLNAERLRKIRTLMENAGIDAREITAALADPPARRFEPQEFQRAAHDAGVEWAKSGGILTIAGPMGTGKTTLAAHAAGRRLTYGHPLQWRITAEMVSGLWANDDIVRAKAERLLYRGTGALVLDDLDIQRTSGAALEALGGLVHRWYRTEQPLLITTNAPSRDALAATYGITGQRIASRLKDGVWIDVRGDDLRGPP